MPVWFSIRQSITFKGSVIRSSKPPGPTPTEKLINSDLGVFARAIQQPALEIRHGEEAHALAAQQALYPRARCNRAARRGEYDAALERK